MGLLNFENTKGRIYVVMFIIIGITYMLLLAMNNKIHHFKNPQPLPSQKSITLPSGEIFRFKSYIAMAADNDASVLKTDECYTGHTISYMNEGKFVLLSNFVYYQIKNHKSNLGIDGKTPTDELIDARIMEIVDVIQENLLHPYIQEVHILVSEQEGIDFLKRINFQNAKKLVLKFTSGESVTLKLQLLYASKCFKNRTIAISIIKIINLVPDGKN